MSPYPRMHFLALLLIVFGSVSGFAQTPDDRASQAFSEAVKLHGAGTPAALDEAAKKYNEAIELWQKAGKELEQARAMNNLAAIYFRSGQLDKAVTTFRGVLKIFERVHGPEHIDVFKTLNNLAMVYAAQGDNANADAMYDRGFPIYEKTLGITDEYLTGLDSLGHYYQRERRFDRAVKMFARLLAIEEKRLSADDPDLAITLTSLALSHLQLGEFKQAEPLYRRALTLREKVFGPESVEAALSLGNFGALYSAQGELGLAEEFDRKALAIYEKKLGKDDPLVGHTLSDLGMLYSRQKKFPEAEQYFKRALSILEKAHGKNAMELSAALQNYANMLRDAGREAEAKKIQERIRTLAPN